LGFQESQAASDALAMELQTTKASLAACEVVLFVPYSSCKSLMKLVDYLGQTTPER
jgi:hypothetical protein